MAGLAGKLRFPFPPFVDGTVRMGRDGTAAPAPKCMLFRRLLRP